MPVCHTQPPQLVRNAVDGNCLKSRIAEDHFVDAAAGGVAVVGGMGIGGENLPQVGNAFQERDGHGLSLGFVVAFGIDLRIFIDAVVVLQGTGDLPGQLIVQAVDQIAHVIGDVPDVQPFAAAVPWVENVLQIGDAFDDFVVIR
jgi:hypothetical protein